MIRVFAQATGAPNSGASNAEDFQPLTRNPQTTQGGLQPGTGPQSTSGLDILNQENARIVVPVTEAQEPTPAPQAVSGGGINWFIVIAVAAVIVAALEYFFRRREKRGVSDTSVEIAPQEVITLPADEPEPVAEPEAEKPSPAEVSAKEAASALPKKKKTQSAKKKSKSKSKRKKSRK